MPWIYGSNANSANIVWVIPKTAQNKKPLKLELPLHRSWQSEFRFLVVQIIGILSPNLCNIVWLYSLGPTSSKIYKNRREPPNELSFGIFIVGHLIYRYSKRQPLQYCFSYGEKIYMFKMLLKLLVPTPSSAAGWIVINHKKLPHIKKPTSAKLVVNSATSSRTMWKYDKN